MMDRMPVQDLRISHSASGRADAGQAGLKHTAEGLRFPNELPKPTAGNSPNEGSKGHLGAEGGLHTSLWPKACPAAHP